MPTHLQVYVSATLPDLAPARAAVCAMLAELGFEAVLRTEPAPAQPETWEALRKRIAACGAVIHLAGICYGDEPSSWPAGEPRTSYAQLEYDFARALQKPLYVYLFEAHYPFDQHEPESRDARVRQEQHRARIRDVDGVYVPVHDPGEFIRGLRGCRAFLSILAQRATPEATQSAAAADDDTVTSTSLRSPAPRLAVPARPANTASSRAPAPTSSFPLAAAVPPEASPAPQGRPPDENVQFTAYKPHTIPPGRWRKLLVFAHLDERPSWLEADERSPIEEIAAQADAILGNQRDQYRPATEDSLLPIPADGEITLVPLGDGLEFDPPRHSLRWRDGVAVQAATFLVRADARLDGRIARGRITVFLGHLIVAEISLAMRVQSGALPAAARAPTVPAESAASRRFRKIFASYSHADVAAVEAMERHAHALGDEYLRDWVTLRSGEEWNPALLRMIEQADVFQLFWSHNASRSRNVEQEWMHALGLRREAFVRPTYWERPMPPAPPPLRAIHFHRLGAAPPLPNAAAAPRPVEQIGPDAESPSPSMSPPSPTAAAMPAELRERSFSAAAPPPSPAVPKREMPDARPTASAAPGYRFPAAPWSARPGETQQRDQFPEETRQYHTAAREPRYAEAADEPRYAAAASRPPRASRSQTRLPYAAALVALLVAGALLAGFFFRRVAHPNIAPRPLAQMPDARPPYPITNPGNHALSGTAAANGYESDYQDAQNELAQGNLEAARSYAKRSVAAARASLPADDPARLRYERFLAGLPAETPVPDRGR